MTSSNDDPQRHAELLAGYALGDLSDSELAVADELLQSDEHLEQLDELERAAAALELVFAQPSLSALPSELASKLRSSITDAAPSMALPRSVISPPNTNSLDDPNSDQSVVAFPSQVRGKTDLSRWAAWACCAAALMLSVTLWYGDQPTKPLAPVAARSLLMQNADDLLTVAWAAGPTPFPTQVTGDVVWSNTLQRGYMRFVGGVPNDPSVEQYQLWIIDPQRDDEPIDGGVFDIPSDGEAVVEIDAKLKVLSPAAFAITIEKPGGVVVSDQSRLPLLAAVE